MMSLIYCLFVVKDNGFPWEAGDIQAEVKPGRSAGEINATADRLRGTEVSLAAEEIRCVFDDNSKIIFVKSS